MASCGSKDSQDNYSTDTFNLEDGQSYDSAVQNLILDYRTPEGVGTLLTLGANSSSVSACTWFLVDKNLAMTNSHCISDTLKDDSTLDCGNILQGKIANRIGDGKLVKCKKVLKYSDIAGKVSENNDYALIELDQSFDDINPFTVSRAGMDEDDLISIHTMNHSSNSSGIYSRYLKHSCVIKSSDVLGKITSKSSSPIIGFRSKGNYTQRCNSVKGNSGSAVVDRQGKVVGILHGALSKGTRTYSSSVSNQMTTNVGIITNLRCVKFSHSALDSSYPLDCTRELAINAQSSIDGLEESIMSGLNEVIEKNLKNQPQIFEYKLEDNKIGDSTFLSFIPKCIHPLEKWSASQLNQISDEGNFLRDNQTLSVDIQTLELDYSFNIDYYGNYSAEYDVELSYSRGYKLEHLEKLDELGSLMMTISHPSIAPMELPMYTCKD